MALAYSLYGLPFAEWIALIADWSKQHPIAGPAIYVACVVVATVMFMPGLAPGILFAAVGTTIGAQFAFLTGRWGARQWVERRVSANQRLQAIEQGLQEEAFLIVVLTRLSLIIPFNVLNYAYGVTSVTTRTHLAATAIGMLPAVALYVYLGTLAHDLGQILSGEAPPSELGYWLAVAGIVAIVVLPWAIHRAASRSLARHLPTLETDDAN